MIQQATSLTGNNVGLWPSWADRHIKLEVKLCNVEEEELTVVGLLN
jgi:hypothetical protein